jgi:uncharacterized protein YegL
MRRLPVYFLIDVSESMVGEPLEQVQDGIATIIKELRTDPYALETVWVSVIAFAGKSQVLMPLTDIIQFYPVKLPIGSGTSLGVGLDALMKEFDSSLIKSTSEQKGDWKPIVFLFTDGKPTDNPRQSIEKWKSNYSNSSFFVSISLGKDTDTKILSEITENNLSFNGTDSASFKQFFKWVTASIKATSTKIAESQTQSIDLTKGADKIIDKAENIEGINKIDESVAVFLAKCQTNKVPYLIKYSKEVKPSEFAGMDLNTMFYKLNGAYVIDEESYNRLSDESSSLSRQISTEELLGFPTCPSCGNQFGFSSCSCGGLLCVGDEEITTCPWCKTQAKFGVGEGHLNINRAKG